MSAPTLDPVARPPLDPGRPPARLSKAFPTLVRPKPGRPLLLGTPDGGLEPLPDKIRRYATLSWLALLVSILPWSFTQTGRITFIAKRPEQVLVATSLGVAFYFAYKANSRFKLAHAWPVVLYSMLAIIALFPPLGGRAGIGSLFRAVRFLLTLVLLLQLVPVLARDRYIPVRGAFVVMKVTVVSTLVTLAIGLGFDGEGRLITQLPAFPAPGLAQWTSLFCFLLIFLMLNHSIPVRSGMAWLAASSLCLFLSHSRTPLVAGGAGFVAGLVAMFVSSQRARRFVSWVMFLVPVIALLFGPAVQAWFLRGQDQSQLSTLTGRTKAWAKVYAFPRDMYSRLFGVGLTDKSIEGLPIDSGYLSVYHEQGRVGVFVMTLIFVVFLARIMSRRPSMARAMALFLVVYVLIASYTETGIGDMSGYVLHLIMAMVLVVVPVVEPPPVDPTAAPAPSGPGARARP